MDVSFGGVTIQSTTGAPGKFFCISLVCLPSHPRRPADLLQVCDLGGTVRAASRSCSGWGRGAGGPRGAKHIYVQSLQAASAAAAGASEQAALSVQ